MASQSQGIQQLLQAEKRAAEKVAEARKSEYGTARLRQAPPRGMWWRGRPARLGLACPGAAASGLAASALRAVGQRGSPELCPALPCPALPRGCSGLAGAASRAAGGSHQGSERCEGSEPHQDPPAITQSRVRSSGAPGSLQDTITIIWPSLGAWLCSSLSFRPSAACFPGENCVSISVIIELFLMGPS